MVTQIAGVTEGRPASRTDPFPTDEPTNHLSRIVDSTTTANTVYTCWAIPGSAENAGVWKIMRQVNASGIQTITFADGNTNFDNDASDRANLVYS